MGVIKLETIKITPQAGPQYEFLATQADICIYGGAAGGGKTYGLLLEPLRHKNVKGFGAVIFRRNSIQIYNEGGLFDESLKIYSLIKGAELKKTPRATWSFNGKGRISFAHIDGDADLYKLQGSQIAMIGFDELTHFTQNQFFYMFSRNRSTCGVKPYIRATCNPDADSWVANFIDWWIDPDTGYPIKERSGKLRFMIRREEIIHWADTKEELWEKFNLNTKHEKQEPRSVSFIASTLFDNKILMDSNPSYLASLKALTLVNRERLLYGNWKIKPAAGLFFSRNQVGNMLPIVPADIRQFVRAWDLAATSETEGGDPAYTAGVLMGKGKDNRFIIIDVINIRQTAADVRKTLRQTAQIDKAKYGNVQIRLPQDPGQAGKDQAQSLVKYLVGFNVKAKAESGGKETRAEPVAAQWQAGNIDIVIADWNDMYFSQLESFPSSKFKDMVDATSMAFTELEDGFNFYNLIS